jgi:hypothetical protein
MAAMHRVIRTVPVQKRRTTAVVFVAPDLDIELKPLTRDVKGIWSEQILGGNLRVGGFRRSWGRSGAGVKGMERGELLRGSRIGRL